MDKTNNFGFKKKKKKKKQNLNMKSIGFEWDDWSDSLQP